MEKRTTIIFAAAFLCLFTACSNSQKEEISDANMTDISVTGDVADTSATEKTVDTDLFVEIPIRELQIDLTNDAVPEDICVYLLGNSKDDPDKAEELVAYEARSVQVVVKDGATEETIYDRKISGDHIGEGQLALVTDQDEWYLFESDCHEQMGYASYTGEVFAWRDGEKITIDKFNAGFVIDLDAASRNMQSGEAIACRDEAIPQFKAAISSWSTDSELLVACDTINIVNGMKGVFVSTDKKQYNLDDFFSSVWERTANRYTVGTFDELMGYFGYYVYDETYPFTYGYYYTESGELIAETWGTTEEDNFIVDINQDGVSELISNVMWGDGARATLIYYKNGSVIWRGYVDGLIDEDYDNISYASEYSYYLPEENMVEIFYWIDALQEYQSKKYKIDLEKINFERYQ